jgi:hypothetical protein
MHIKQKERKNILAVKIFVGGVSSLLLSDIWFSCTYPIYKPTVGHSEPFGARSTLELEYVSKVYNREHTYYK